MPDFKTHRIRVRIAFVNVGDRHCETLRFRRHLTNRLQEVCGKCCNTALPRRIVSDQRHALRKNRLSFYSGESLVFLHRHCASRSLDDTQTHLHCHRFPDGGIRGQPAASARCPQLIPDQMLRALIWINMTRRLISPSNPASDPQSQLSQSW